MSYKTGAFFFLLSRVTGASFRLFLVALAMQYIIFDEMGVPFWATVVISILLIWIYTYRGGIKTIVWTDTLQTLAMLTAVGVAIYLINQKFDVSFIEFLNSPEFALKSKIFYFDDPFAKTYFLKYFIGGIFIVIGYFQAMLQGMARYDDLEFRKSLHAWQMARLKLGKPLESIPPGQPDMS